jgi:very-short-patch-repair endonuclease
MRSPEPTRAIADRCGSGDSSRRTRPARPEPGAASRSRSSTLCERHGLPPPLVNQELLPAHTVDFLFADQRVAVETDSWRWHRGRAAFERDRERDATLAAIGYRTLRFTDRQIEHAPETVALAVAAALDAPLTRASSRPSSGTPTRSAA